MRTLRPMLIIAKCAVRVAFAATFLFATADAGTTGKIRGLVKDKKTGEVLIGANVRVDGTGLGASTDIDGMYTILNVPPGEYSLVVSMVGYGPSRITEVRVKIDLTTTIDVELAEALVEAQEVVVVAERPLIQRDLTATTAVVGREELNVLPVTEFSQVLALQAGFVSGSLRGGRSGEVAYWIDGVPVTDVYDGSQVVEVNKNLVQEMQLVSGAFNAEYGQAMSGIVNIATREGGGSFNGGLGFYGGDYVSGDNVMFMGIDRVAPFAIRNFEGNLSGPLFGEDVTFFVNGRHIYFGGYLNGVRRFNPSNIAYTDSTGTFKLYRDASGKGDSAFVPMNWSERGYAQGKLTVRVTPTLKASYNAIYDDNVAKAYSRGYTLNPDGIGNTLTTSLTQILQVTHTLSSSSFYTLGGSYFDKWIRYHLYDDPHDRRYIHPQVSQTYDSYSAFTGGTDLGRFERRTQSFLIKADLSTQVDASNLVKVGVETRRHSVEMESYTLRPILGQSAFNPASSSPFITTEIPADTEAAYNRYLRRPEEFSAYVQDKMEFKDLIINIGFRVDWFLPDGVVLADESDPSIYNPLKPSNRFHDNNGNGSQDSGEATKTAKERSSYWYKKARNKFQVSPRFGASFPISASGVVHFSYGHFFQVPRFERLYENPDFKIGSGSGEHIAVVGNADLVPEQTISGELGVQQQVNEDISMDLTLYFRDIRNLTGTRGAEIVVFGGSATYDKYVNSDFGFVKGIVLSFNKRFVDGFGATLDYTYQVANGTASDPSAARNALAGGALPEVQQVPLAWDQRHTLNVTASYNGEAWGLSLIGQYGSGSPYTPRRSADATALLTNSQTKPQYFNVDGRTYYTVDLDALRLVLFARVFNLFDIRNEVGVFDDTGRAGFTTDIQRARATNPREYVNTIDEYFRIPTNYSEPRRVEFGMNVEF
ncbi:MAG: hypothetical protein A2X67_07600 [Ignavibacteria bacterium GWA2_55_11]|nr:MAG: hypothetical protein A2X67_07600 [Ignavibacteria bacterium GWA2_55_11]